ncbi:MAG: protein kinase [Myxococcales bacterium]|nr:protein kinase [Myxococcales bacterium]
MAQLWLAVQRGPHGFEKTAVLKVILPELCSNDDFVHMFLDEARLAAGIDHNNVVRIYDFGEIGGQYYIAMEHLPGEDLASIAQAAKRANRALPIELMCDVMIGAATGLHFAHELTDSAGRPLNVVHRDVSPSNIIVTYHGTVKLVDFGIARAETNITKTAAGTLKGKVAYVSPEQAAGEPVDRRSDVFALGTVLYEMLTLHRPFKRESDLATLKAIVEAEIPAPSSLRPDIPAELDAIILKSLERDASRRHQGAAELADELGGFLVARRYVHSERAMADFMAGLFDADRRIGKLRVAQVTTTESPDGNLKTPSQLKHLPQHLSPIRSFPSMPAVQPPAAAPGEPDEADQATTLEPTLARRQRRTRRLIAGAVGALVLAIVGAAITLRPSEPEPVTPPVEPPKPLVAVPPPPQAEPEKPEPITDGPQVPPERDPKPAEVKAGDPKPARPRAARGKLTLDTTPWSEVYLKGKKLGDTPLVDYSLPPGLHVLTLVNDGKGVKSVIEVDIQSGKTTVKKLKL